VIPYIFLFKADTTLFHFQTLYYSIDTLTIMESLHNLGGETRKLLPLLPDVVAVGVAITTGFMLGTSASRKAGIFSVCHPVIILSYSLMLA
jgi:hypothetical protein